MEIIIKTVDTQVWEHSFCLVKLNSETEEGREMYTLYGHILEVGTTGKVNAPVAY